MLLPFTRTAGGPRSGDTPSADWNTINPGFNKLVDVGGRVKTKGIKVPGVLISRSYFIIIDLKLVMGYQSDGREVGGKFAPVN